MLFEVVLPAFIGLLWWKSWKLVKEQSPRHIRLPSRRAMLDRERFKRHNLDCSWKIRDVRPRLIIHTGNSQSCPRTRLSLRIPAKTRIVLSTYLFSVHRRVLLDSRTAVPSIVPSSQIEQWILSMFTFDLFPIHHGDDTCENAVKKVQLSISAVAFLYTFLRFNFAIFVKCVVKKFNT